MRRGGKREDSVRLGRTIVAQRERAESESERLKERKKQKCRKMLTGTGVVCLFLILGALMLITWKEVVMREQEEVAKGNEYPPTVEIVDESAARKITARVKDFVGKAERDFAALGYKVEKAIVPADKTREVHVYLKDSAVYYKLNLDRGSAESVEDAVRMLRYLEEKGQKATAYIDVRVPRKGYYK